MSHSGHHGYDEGRANQHPCKGSFFLEKNLVEHCVSKKGFVRAGPRENIVWAPGEVRAAMCTAGVHIIWEGKPKAVLEIVFYYGRVCALA